MTVEEVKLQAKASGGHGAKDQFPVGMRVLAVDDDPTCLKVLENLLLRCQYHGMPYSCLLLLLCFSLFPVCLDSYSSDRIVPSVPFLFSLRFGSLLDLVFVVRVARRLLQRYLGSWFCIHINSNPYFMPRLLPYWFRGEIFLLCNVMSSSVSFFLENNEIFPALEKIEFYLVFTHGLIWNNLLAIRSVDWTSSRLISLGL